MPLYLCELPPGPWTQGNCTRAELGCPKDPSAHLRIRRDRLVPHRALSPRRHGVLILSDEELLAQLFQCFSGPHWRPRRLGWERDPMSVINLSGNTRGTCRRQGMPGLVLYKRPMPSPNRSTCRENESEENYLYCTTIWLVLLILVTRGKVWSDNSGSSLTGGGHAARDWGANNLIR